MNRMFCFRIVFIFFLVPVLGCSSQDNYPKAVAEILRKWDAANQVASSTSRMALSGPVARLQQIKIQAEKIDVPGQDKDCHAYLIRYMDSTTRAYLEFMRNGGVPPSKELSKKDWDKFYLCSPLFEEQRALEAKARAEEEQKAKIEEERKREEQRARLEQLKAIPWDKLKDEISALSEPDLRAILGEPVSIKKLDDDNTEFDYEIDGRKIQIYLSGGKISGFSEIASGSR